MRTIRIRYLTAAQVRQANEIAQQRGYERSLPLALVQALRESIYPVAAYEAHDGSVRCEIAFDTTFAHLDVDAELFASLGQAKVPAPSRYISPLHVTEDHTFARLDVDADRFAALSRADVPAISLAASGGEF